MLHGGQGSCMPLHGHRASHTITVPWTAKPMQLHGALDQRMQRKWRSTQMPQSPALGPELRMATHRIDRQLTQQHTAPHCTVLYCTHLQHATSAAVVAEYLRALVATGQLERYTQAGGTPVTGEDHRSLTQLLQDLQAQVRRCDIMRSRCCRCDFD